MKSERRPKIFFDWLLLWYLEEATSRIEMQKEMEEKGEEYFSNKYHRRRRKSKAVQRWTKRYDTFKFLSIFECDTMC